MAEKSDKKEKKSLINSIGIIKEELEKEFGVYDHVLFGVDVMDDGSPGAIIQSVRTGAYIGLGLLKAIKLMIARADEQIESGYMKLLDREEELANSISSKALSKLKSDEVIRKVIMEYNERIGEAIKNKDKDALDNLRKEIIDKISKLKGGKFDAEILFGGIDDNPENNDDDKSGFDMDDLSKSK